MATYKKCFLSENEMERTLEESGSKGGGDVFSESEYSSESESVSKDNAEESSVENSESSNSDDTAPPASKTTKEEG
jgi:hypothetical protein